MAASREAYPFQHHKDILLSRYAQGMMGVLLPHQIIFNPLEFYLDPVYQEEVIPEQTVYVTAAASSGGYRALQELLGIPPNSTKQQQVIRMNTGLIGEMVGCATFPPELEGKTVMIPHQIGTGIPAEYGTLLGKNEAHLMMQWLMRIAGVSAKTAEQFCNTMFREHQPAIDFIGGPLIQKKDKYPFYTELVQTFLDTLKVTGDPIRPFSAVLLGFDWKNSLGSQIEASVAHLLSIPTYEITLDETHAQYVAFLRKHHLQSIADRIHLPRMQGDGENLIKTIPLDPKQLSISLERVLSGLH